MLKMLSKKRGQKGFTLVELMVVVVIIGVLVAIAIPIYGLVTRNAERRAVEANLRTINGAIATYYAAEVAPVTALTEIADLTPNYLPVVPVGPSGVTYGIAGTAPNQVGTATGTVGGATITAATLPIAW